MSITPRGKRKNTTNGSLSKRGKKVSLQNKRNFVFTNDDFGTAYDAEACTTNSIFDETNLRASATCLRNPDDTQRVEDFAFLVELEVDDDNGTEKILCDVFYVPATVAKSKKVNEGWYIHAPLGSDYKIVLMNHTIAAGACSSEMLQSGDVVGVIRVDGNFVGEDYLVKAFDLASHCGTFDVYGFHKGENEFGKQDVHKFKFSSAIDTNNTVDETHEDPLIGRIEVEFYEAIMDLKINHPKPYSKEQRTCGRDTKQAVEGAISTQRGIQFSTPYESAPFCTGEKLASLSAYYRPTSWFVKHKIFENSHNDVSDINSSNNNNSSSNNNNSNNNNSNNTNNNSNCTSTSSNDNSNSTACTTTSTSVHSCIKQERTSTTMPRLQSISGVVDLTLEDEIQVFIFLQDDNNSMSPAGVVVMQSLSISLASLRTTIALYYPEIAKIQYHFMLEEFPVSVGMEDQFKTYQIITPYKQEGAKKIVIKK